MNRHYRPSILLKAGVVILAFLIIVAVAIISNILLSLEGDPYSTLLERLDPRFYLRTAGILLFSSLLYTPISYGISYSFWQSNRREVKFSDFFMLFLKPIILFKAVGLRLIIWFVRGFGQILVLLFGVATEVIISLLSLIKDGVEVLKLSSSDFLQKLWNEIALRHWPGVSMLAWGAVIIWFIVTFWRFSFCKYALLRFNELTPLECLRVGLTATKGRVLQMIHSILKLYSYYILVVLSFGLLRKRLSPYRKEPFSVLAVRWVEQGRGIYFHKKSLDK